MQGSGCIRDRRKTVVEVDPKTKEETTLSPATINRDLCALKSAFNKAIKWGFIQTNPIKGESKLKESPGRVRYLMEDEWPKIKEAAQKGPPFLYPAIFLARETGLRQGEIRRLRWSDVDSSKNLIRVHNTKGNRIEMIPINSVVQELLWKLPRETEYVLVSDKKIPLSAVMIDRAWREIIEAAGITDLRFHDLRHDFGSRIVMAGKGIEAARALLRHKDLRMTLRYSHLSPQYLRDAVEAIVDHPRSVGSPVGPRLSQQKQETHKCWWSQRDSNPCLCLERAPS